MLRFPTLSKISAKKQSINGFKGINQSLYVGYNEFADMKNMSGDYYPVLSTRKKRGIVNDDIPQSTGVEQMGASDKLYYTAEVDYNGEHGRAMLFFYGDNDNEGVELNAQRNKTLVNIANGVVILPDKVLYRNGDLDNIENTWMWSTYGAGAGDNPLTVRKCDADGNSPTTYTYGTTQPTDPTAGDYWLDKNTVPWTMKQYFETTGEWVPVALDYIRIEGTNINRGFKAGDVVKIQDITVSDMVFDGDFYLYAVGGNETGAPSIGYLVVKIATKMTDVWGNAIGTSPTVSRTMPNMDFIVESNNRLWGCSSENHEIYASKLGDPTNWNVFQGTAADSYAATIGSIGDFTGAAVHEGRVVFFKEDCFHIIYGTEPSNFQIDTVYAPGIEKGNAKSACVINEILYYKGRNGIYEYNGALPVSISEALGDKHYSDAVAGSIGEKYYISMKDESGAWSLFVYDTKRGLWHKEDDVHANGFVKLDGELYCDAYTSLFSVNGSANGLTAWTVTQEPDFEWYAETGDIGADMADSKYISKLQFRMEADKGTKVKIELQYDKDGVWEQKFMLSPCRLRVFTVPIIPRRCDTMRIRISGKGGFKLYNITKTIEQGSEL